MNQADALRRLEQIESQARQEDLRPVLEQLAAENDLDPDDILREAWRIREATEGLSRGQALAWVAQDLAATTGLGYDEALELARTAYDAA